MKLDAFFIKNIQSTYGKEGEVWLNNLPNHLQQLAAQWNFEIIQPVKDLSYNFVAVVKLQSGLAILKTAPPSARLIEEAEWLGAHKKCVPIIFHKDKINNAYLMEKLEPGISLKYFVNEDDEKATRIISQIILDLQTVNPMHQVSYQHIAKHISSFDFLQSHIDKKMIDCGKSIFNELCNDRSKDIILHGDLHHDNILRSGNSWSVIDPQGYIGDPCAEVGPMIFNPVDCFPKHRSMQNTLKTRLKILAEMLPYDSQRINGWTFCLALRSSAWDVEGFDHVNHQTIEIAKTLYHFL